MRTLKLYRLAQITLWVLLLTGLLVRLLVRAPEGTAAAEIYDRVELTGRAREVMMETVRLVQAIAADAGTMDPAETVRRLANANQTKDAAGRVKNAIQETDSNWMQLKEAAPLMADCEKLLQRAIDRVLTPPTAAGEPPANPGFEETALEAIPILQTRARQLEDQAVHLSVRMQQAITKGVFARGTLFGLTAADILLATLTLSSLVGVAVLIQGSRRLRTPMAKLQRMELELMGRSDRREALHQCHDRVKELLELAGGFCRSDKR
ncbi:MAG: hypothetical protein ACC628_18835 [Pirellulaceae bacterium]